MLCAKALVGDEPFVVMLGDDIIDAAVPAAKQLAACYERHGLGTIALMEVPPAETHMYGIAAGPAARRPHHPHRAAGGEAEEGRRPPTWR